jgi:hypothetical protein
MKRFLLTSTCLLAALTPALAQTAPIPAAPADPVAAVVHDTTLLGMVANAGWVMIPLAFASILTITLVLYCLFTLTERSPSSRTKTSRASPITSPIARRLRPGSSIAP